MDRHESTGVLHGLLAGYPLVDLDDASLLAWAEAIEDCGSEPARALEIARRWPRTHDRFPSLAEFLNIITPASLRYQPANPDTADDPDAIRPDPATAHKLARVWRTAIGQVNDRVKRIGASRGRDGHWHGGPDPCPLCGVAPPPGGPSEQRGGTDAVRPPTLAAPQAGCWPTGRPR